MTEIFMECPICKERRRVDILRFIPQNNNFNIVVKCAYCGIDCHV